MATTAYALTNAAWTDCGSTPCTIQAPDGAQIAFVIDTTIPGSLTADCMITPSRSAHSVTTASQKVWARSLAATGRLVVYR